MNCISECANKLHKNLDKVFWATKITLNCVTRVTCVNRPLQINHLLYLNVTNILLISLQIPYITIFNIMNHLFNKQIYPATLLNRGSTVHLHR